MSASGHVGCHTVTPPEQRRRLGIDNHRIPHTSEPLQAVVRPLLMTEG